MKVRAPSDPGSYEVRYILGRGNKLLAKTTIEIKSVSAQVQAPASADMATAFEVAWQGPGNKEDYISVARPDQVRQLRQLYLHPRGQSVEGAGAVGSGHL